MVFGMCATRFIAFIVGFVTDIVATNKSVEVASGASSGGSEGFTGPRFEEVVEEKKTK